MSRPRPRMRYKSFMRFALNGQVLRVAGKLSLPRGEFSWSSDEEHGFPSHIVHRGTNLIVGYVGDDSLEFAHYEDRELEARTQEPRRQLYRFLSSVIPLHERISTRGLAA